MMSKMVCRCGNVISGTLVPCPTEGGILRDQDQEPYQDKVGEDIAAFFSAVAAGQRESWIANFFGPHYPSDGSDASVVSDLLCHRDWEFFLSVAECNQCGRLWIQPEPCVNSYLSFAPDEPGYASLLRAKTKIGARPVLERTPATPRE
jgi:hypothetical protein